MVRLMCLEIAARTTFCPEYLLRQKVDQSGWAFTRFHGTSNHNILESDWFFFSLHAVKFEEWSLLVPHLGVVCFLSWRSRIQIQPNTNQCKFFTLILSSSKCLHGLCSIPTIAFGCGVCSQCTFPIDLYLAVTNHCPLFPHIQCDWC